jgi:hypothetical protein
MSNPTITNSGKQKSLIRPSNARRARGRMTGGAVMPSDIQTQPIQKMVLRYICVDGSPDTIVTVQNLLGWQLAVATTTTSTAAISTTAAFRVTRVKVWGINDSSTANVNETLSMTWLGSGGLGLSRAITSTGTDALPAHISTTPPEDSECGWWHSYNATQTVALFTVSNAPIGSILDIHIEYISTGQSTAGSTAPLASTTQRWTLASAVASGIYRQQLTVGGTLGSTASFNPVQIAYVVSPTSQAIV